MCMCTMGGGWKCTRLRTQVIVMVARLGCAMWGHDFSGNERLSRKDGVRASIRNGEKTAEHSLILKEQDERGDWCVPKSLNTVLHAPSYIMQIRCPSDVHFISRTYSRKWLSARHMRALGGAFRQLGGGISVCAPTVDLLRLLIISSNHMPLCSIHTIMSPFSSDVVSFR